MKIEYDAQARALYFQVKEGAIADTVEIGDDVSADVDDQQEKLGIEFLDLDTFLSFLQDHGGTVSLPVPVTRLTRAKSA